MNELSTLARSEFFLKCLEKELYCAFDIFQKVVFCSALYTEEANLQTFVMINENHLS